MCSQRLTRPGKLCRECERELDRARAAQASVDTLSPAMPLVDVARLANEAPGGWTGYLHARPVVVIGAFAVGLAAAVALYVAELPHSAAPAASVMIDRDLTNVRPRERRAPPPLVPVEPAPRAVAPARDPIVAVKRAPTLVTAVTTTHTSTATEPPRAATMTAHSRSAAPTSYDRVLGLADALETCSHETFFARIACEHRARTRFCEAAGAPQIPQCAERPPREYGQ